MNYSLASLEIAVVLLGIALLLLDLWTPPSLRPRLGYAAALGVGFVLLFSFSPLLDTGRTEMAFGGMFVLDGMALFFKRIFLVAAILVLLLAVDFSDRITAGISEYYSLMLFALAGMLCAASANDFSLLFVSIELITVSFYVLTSFQRSRLVSLEAGVKYLILGALSSALLVFGLALVFGTTGCLNFGALAEVNAAHQRDPVFLGGMLLVLAGLGFKIAAFPLQIWAPDVYQGSPTPTAAFLAIGSKAAGFVLLLRVLLVAVPDLAAQWHRFLLVVAGITLLYGNLCAIPQRNLKRLMGYSSIAHAGYLLLGIATLSDAGQSAVLFYLATYLFSVLAVFGVISVVFRGLETEEIAELAGLHQRSPFLAAVLALAMVSLAGIPPLAGFFGKFLLFKAAVEQGPRDAAYFWAVGVAVVGVVISLYYYLGVVRAIYWPGAPQPLAALTMSQPLKWALGICVITLLLLGLAPGALVNLTQTVVAALR